MRNKSQLTPEINSSSMADIAFLLLIFFLVTTTITNDKGIFLQLPPSKEIDTPIIPIHERNLFKISINSADKLLVNDESFEDLDDIRMLIRTFVLNYGEDKSLSVSPDKAVVSIKTYRGTSYSRFIAVLNEVQGTYYDIYAENVDMTNADYRNLDPSSAFDLAIIQKAKKGIPMNISIAEPSN